MSEVMGWGGGERSGHRWALTMRGKLYNIEVTGGCAECESRKRLKPIQ